MLAERRRAGLKAIEHCGRVEQTVEVVDGAELSLGPFPAGACDCRIESAWYGVGLPGAGGACAEEALVTEAIRARWDAKNGMALSKITTAEVGHLDPAPGQKKTLVIRYSLSQIRTKDVVDTSYAAGVGLVVPVAVKVVTNTLGFVLAAAGYTVGKLWSLVHAQSSVADSTIFQWGLYSTLFLNGISPRVTYDSMLGDLQERLQALSPAPSFWPVEEREMRQTPLIVANHTCYMDGFVLTSLFGLPKVLAKSGSTNMPLVRTFARELGVLEVDRSSKDSRKATAEAIAGHVAAWLPSWRPLLLFPEGTTSNGEGLLDFKQGAFAPGAPVRPVVLYYDGDWNPANVNFKVADNGEIVPTGDAEWALQFMGHMSHSIRIRVLPPYIPDEAERADASLFAANVRALMAEAHATLQAESASSKARRQEGGCVACASAR